MKKRWLVVFLWFIGVCLPTFYHMIHFHYGPFTAFIRWIHTPFVETEWAASFSEENFDKVETGMNQKEVILLLGAPLYDSNYGSPLDYSNYKAYVIWHYSTGKTISSDFDRRRVYFDSWGNVKKTKRNFYID